MGDEAGQDAVRRPVGPPARDPRPVLNRDTRDGLLLGAGLTALSYAVGLLAGWIHTVDPVEAVAVLTSYGNVWLCVRERRFNYPVGALSTAAYCLLFWRADLLASAALNAYLTPALVYGWVRWRADADTRPVTRVAARWAPAYGVVALLALGGATWLTRSLGGAFALTDSVVLVGTVLAQLLLDNKKLESWLVWALVDVVAAWQYTASGLVVAGLQYVLFLANALWALVVWRRSMHATAASGQGPAAAVVEEPARG